MSEVLTTEVTDLPDISYLVTEDDNPVDNFFSEKLQRLLTECLYSSWFPGIPFLAAANVGIFAIAGHSPIVPDVFLSLDVQVAQNWWEKKHRSYFIWEFGKPPEVVIEIVSNKVGEELGSKLKAYERMRVSYYVIYDPTQQLSETSLRIYELQGNSYEAMTETWLKKVGLGLTLWQGEFEGKQERWLRWCDHQGNIIPTGAERAVQLQSQLEQERQKAAQLAERLRALGIDPNNID